MKRTMITLASLVLIAFPAWACDLCAVYSSLGSESLSPGSLHLSISEQYTVLDDIRMNGEKVDNPFDENLNSSITQFSLGYDLTPQASLQLSVPLIYRAYHRIEHGARQSGSESGLGDISLLGRVRPFRYDGVDSSVQLKLFGGVKLPTGDADRLSEEINEDHSTDEEMEISDPEFSTHDDHIHSAETILRHGAEEHEASSVHGHDLALGSGSTDIPVGASFFARYQRAVTTASVQYTFRQNGRFDYRYGDDALARVGAGGYLLLSEDRSALFQIVLSGEHKEKDSRHGEKFDDTYMTAFFLGPELRLSFGDKLSGDLGWDFVTNVENNETMIAPTSRFRLGATYRF